MSYVCVVRTLVPIAHSQSPRHSEKVQQFHGDGDLAADLGGSPIDPPLTLPDAVDLSMYSRDPLSRMSLAEDLKGAFEI